jgi:hypothetical protein
MDAIMNTSPTTPLLHHRLCPLRSVMGSPPSPVSFSGGILLLYKEHKTVMMLGQLNSCENIRASVFSPWILSSHHSRWSIRSG